MAFDSSEYPVGCESVENGKVNSQALHSAQNGLCFYCRKPVSVESVNAEHVVPKSSGGRNDGTNVVACCEKTNTALGCRSAKDKMDMVLAFITAGKDPCVEIQSLFASGNLPGSLNVVPGRDLALVAKKRKKKKVVLPVTDAEIRAAFASMFKPGCGRIRKKTLNARHASKRERMALTQMISRKLVGKSNKCVFLTQRGREFIEGAE